MQPTPHKTTKAALTAVPALLWKRFGAYFLLYFVPLLAVVGFLKIAGEVGEGETLSFDRSVLLHIHQHHSGALDTFMKVFTELGGPIALPIFVVASGLYLLKRHKTEQGLLLIVGVGGAAIINVLLKLVYQRQRPHLWAQIIVEHSPSFPSGHAMASSAVATAVILIAWPTRFRSVVAITAVALTLVISYSRLYFGVHYPTDIIAGWLAGVGWVLIVSAVLKKHGASVVNK